MPREAADVAAGELVAALMAGVERVAAEKVAAQMEELECRRCRPHSGVLPGNRGETVRERRACLCAGARLGCTQGAL